MASQSLKFTNREFQALRKEFPESVTVCFRSPEARERKLSIKQSNSAEKAKIKMNLVQSRIDEIERNIAKQQENKMLYQSLLPIFDGIEFPDDVNLYAYTYNEGVNTWVEINPSWDAKSKDLQPIIHAICKKHSLDFKKKRSYNEESLDYSARLEFHGEDGAVTSVVRIQVCGVVPSTCHVEETEVPLTSEEIVEATKEALANVKITRTVKKIVCE